MFSKAEKTVVKLVLTGLSNKEIAEKLSLKEKTVKYHLTNVYKKSSTKGRASFIVKFLNAGLTV